MAGEVVVSGGGRSCPIRRERNEEESRMMAESRSSQAEHRSARERFAILVAHNPSTRAFLAQGRSNSAQRAGTQNHRNEQRPPGNSHDLSFRSRGSVWAALSLHRSSASRLAGSPSV